MDQANDAPMPPPLPRARELENRHLLGAPAGGVGTPDRHLKPTATGGRRAPDVRFIKHRCFCESANGSGSRLFNAPDNACGKPDLAGTNLQARYCSPASPFGVASFTWPGDGWPTFFVCPRQLQNLQCRQLL